MKSKALVLIFTTMLVSCKSEPEFFYVTGQFVCEVLAKEENGLTVLKECTSLSAGSALEGVEIINPVNILKMPNIEVK